MLRNLSVLFCACAVLALTGCAVAPLSNHITARSNGKGESLASLGSTIGTKESAWLPSIKYSLGITDDLDIGFQYEVIEYGAWGKYAIVNNKGNGFSLAGLLGVGLSFEGYYTYFGPILSWKLDWFEPYLMTRFNYVRYDAGRIEINTTGDFQVDPGTYRYFQHTAGFMTWPLDWFGMGLEASAFTTLASKFVLKDKSPYIFSGNFSFRF